MVATQEAQVIPETLRKHFSRSSSIAAPPFLKDTDPLSISICMLPWWEEEDEEVGLAGPFFLGCTTCTSGLSEYKRGQHLWVLLLYTFMLIAQRQKSRYSCTIDHLIRKITLNDKKIYFHILNCQAWRQYVKFDLQCILKDLNDMYNVDLLRNINIPTSKVYWYTSAQR